MQLLNSIPEQVLVALMVSALLAVLGILWRASRMRLSSYAARPTPRWDVRLNRAYAGRAEVIRRVQAEPEIEVLNAASPLDAEQNQYAEVQRQLLASEGKPNDLHGLMSGIPDWDCDRIRLRVIPVDYASVLSLRKHGERPAVLSASAVILCPETRQILLHRRSPESATYPEALHTIGGAYQPSTGIRASTDHRSLLATLEREVLEESGLRISVSDAPTMVLAREIDTGFVQLVVLGATVRREQIQHLEDSWEGDVTLFGVDQVPDLVLHQLTPSGALHVMAWLAFGAPGLGINRRIAGASPRRLFANLLQRI